MSWSTPVVAANSGAWTATSPITIAYAGQVGRLYHVVAVRASAADPYTTVTDDGAGGANVWTRIHFYPTAGGTGRRIEVWTCVPTVTFTAISLAFTGAGTAGAALVETTGQRTADLVNVHTGGERSSSGAPAGFAFTPDEADTLVLAAIQWNSNTDSQIIAPTGFTKLTGVNNAGPSIAYLIGPASDVAITPAWTKSGGANAGSGQSNVAYNMLAVASGPTVTVWDGASEVAVGGVTVWDGASEVAASIDTVV
jgi:hypothetical protein